MSSVQKNEDILAQYLNYVGNHSFVWNKDKYVQRRVLDGKVGEKEGHIVFQYCLGGAYAEGWFGNVKFRIYSSCVNPTADVFVIHHSPADAVILESSNTELTVQSITLVRAALERLEEQYTKQAQG